MKKLFQTVLDAIHQGREVVLCTILASSGSSPRGAGARMAVFAEGSTLGTVGGGAVEQEAIKLALQVHRTRQPLAKAFCLRPDQVNDIGMICGGDVTVYFQLLTESDRPFLEDLLRLLSGTENGWQVLALREGQVEDMGLFDAQNGLRYVNQLTEDQIRPLLQARAVYQKGDPTLYAEPICQAGTVYIFGGGHVGKALVPVLKGVGFRVTVFDNRPDYATEFAHPQADRVLLGDYAHIGDQIRIGPEDYVVIMTPGHQADSQVLLQAMATDATYIGCIGSRHKVAATNKFLVEQGIPEDRLGRIHSPIGLPIQAQTPEEIAISIAGELILHRAKHAKGEI